MSTTARSIAKFAVAAGEFVAVAAYQRARAADLAAVLAVNVAPRRTGERSGSAAGRSVTCRSRRSANTCW